MLYNEASKSRGNPLFYKREMPRRIKYMENRGVCYGRKVFIDVL